MIPDSNATALSVPDETRIVRPHTLNLQCIDVCNSRCIMCHIWKDGRREKMSIDELRVELANPAARRLFGLTAPAAVWSPPDALRQPLADALRDQRAHLTDTFDQALTLRADGGERVYLPQVRPIRGDRGDTDRCAHLICVERR